MNTVSSSASYNEQMRAFLNEKFWKFVMIILVAPCLYAFSYRKNMTADADWLAGRPEIERFFRINLTCLIGGDPRYRVRPLRGVLRGKA